MKVIPFILLFLLLSCNPDEMEVPAPFFDVNEIAYCNIQTFSATEADFIVHDVKDFLKAISIAEPGNTIYIRDTSYLDLSDYELPVIINKSLNIVSGRNSDNANGATLYSKAPGKTLIKIDADNVTIHGLKILGNDSEIGTEAYIPSVTTGLSIENNNFLRVENCEISGWSFAGIRFFNSHGNIMLRNYIHHNRRKGLGYGISLHNNPGIKTEALITCNNFEYNRHDIAASGNEGQSYEASYNIIGIRSEGIHSFDMHGKNGDIEKIAGTRISIHNNIFLSNIGFAIKIRGIPEEKANIYNNFFAHQFQKEAISQSILKKIIPSDNYVNVNCYNNKFGIKY